MSIKSALEWAARQIGAAARVVGADELSAGATPWRLRIDHRGVVVEAVLRVGDAGGRQRLATEAAALLFAEGHRLPAPRLLAADPDGDAAGRPALLMTLLPGTSTIPRIASVARLRAAGAAAARIHAVPAAPRPDLPSRVRPLADVDFAAERRTTGSSSLLRAAEERVNHLPLPQGPTVFVHGDLWQGNTLWTADTFVGMVDWDAAGAGHPGVDLGTLRCDAAVVFGLPATAEILRGWREATGRPAEATAYWDLVAALTTPTDMARWLPVAHHHGRADLTTATLNTRRDAFLRAALDQLPHN